MLRSKNTVLTDKLRDHAKRFMMKDYNNDGRADQVLYELVLIRTCMYFGRTTKVSKVPTFDKFMRVCRERKCPVDAMVNVYVDTHPTTHRHRESDARSYRSSNGSVISRQTQESQESGITIDMDGNK